MNFNYTFIGGSGRSGTNVLRELLNKHPDVGSLPFEHRFLIDPDGLVDFISHSQDCWSPFMSDNRIKRLEAFLLNLSSKNKKGPYKDWELSRWFPEYNANVDKLILQLIEFKYEGSWPGISPCKDMEIWYSSISKQESQMHISNFIKTNIDQLLIKGSKNHYVEDNTWNILFFDKILTLMPRSKLIHIVRDPKDVISSYCAQSWCPKDVIQSTSMYKSIMERWMDVQKKLPKESYLIIKLEDLALNPEFEIKKVCDFIQLTYHPSLLDMLLDKANIGRYRNFFSIDEVSFIEKETMFIMNELGY